MRERRKCGTVDHEEPMATQVLLRVRHVYRPGNANSENRARASALPFPSDEKNPSQVQNDDVHTPQV